MKTTFRSKLILAALTALTLGLGLTSARATSTPATANAVAPQSTPVSSAGTPVIAPIPAERMALAKKYIESVPVEADVKAAVEQLSERISPDQRVLYRSLADSSIDYAKLRSAAETATAEIFTDDEIRAMTAFFSTQEGKSMRAKLPIYEQRMAPVMMDIMQSFAMKLQQNAITVQPEGGAAGAVQPGQ